MALWPGWLSLIEEGVCSLGANYRAGLQEQGRLFLRLPRGQDLRRIRYNRGVAIFRLAVRVKAVVALR